MCKTYVPRNCDNMEELIVSKVLEYEDSLILPSYKFPIYVDSLLSFDSTYYCNYFLQKYDLTLSDRDNVILKNLYNCVNCNLFSYNDFIPFKQDTLRRRLRFSPIMKMGDKSCIVSYENTEVEEIAYLFRFRILADCKIGELRIIDGIGGSLE